MSDFFQSHLLYYLFLMGLFGLCVGSFLNVVIYRLPLMLKKEWQTECQSLLSLPEAANENGIEHFNLFIPRSHCPHCKTTLFWYYNIPLISYLFLKAQCAFCHKKISVRYFIVEFLAAFFSLFSAWHFGFSFAAVAATLFCFVLIALVFIDLALFLLPDQLTLFLLWVGLLLSVFSIFVSSQDAILGAALGYSLLWGIATLFYLVTHVEGMGHGDFKLAAAIGAWLGWQRLPLFITFSALFALLIGGIFVLIQKKGLRTPIPFGPFLALSGFLMLFWGNRLSAFYYSVL